MPVLSPPKLARTALAVIAAGAAMTAAASAATILSPVAAPFTTGSALQLTGQATPGNPQQQHDFENIVVQSDSFNNVTGAETLVLGATEFGQTLLGGVTPDSISAASTLTFVLAGRTGMSQTGTFAETVTGYTTNGIDSLGNLLIGSLNPGQASTGSVTIAADPTGGFDITNSFTFYAQDTINNGSVRIATPAAATSAPIGFVATPTPTTAVPEPASLALLGVSIAGLGLIRRRGA